LSSGEMKFIAWAKDTAEKVSQSGDNKPFTLTLGMYKVSGSWGGDEKDSAAIREMFAVAQGIFKEYGITVQDQTGNTNPSKVKAQIVGASPDSAPPGGEASFEYMKQQVLQPRGGSNTINILFSSEMAISKGCGVDAGACSQPGTHMTIIPEFSHYGRTEDVAGDGFHSILAHEIGHHFALQPYPGGHKEGYTDSLMKEYSPARHGYRISDQDARFLRTIGYLPDYTSATARP